MLSTSLPASVKTFNLSYFFGPFPACPIPLFGSQKPLPGIHIVATAQREMSRKIARSFSLLIFYAP